MADRIEEEDAPWGHRDGREEHNQRQELALSIEEIATAVRAGADTQGMSEALRRASEQVKEIGK